MSRKKEVKDKPEKNQGKKVISQKKKSETIDDSSANKSLPIVGVGASAGGLEAFKKFLENLPASDDKRSQGINSIIKSGGLVF
jgi:chemotaxis response regulator CheB